MVQPAAILCLSSILLLTTLHNIFGEPGLQQQTTASFFPVPSAHQIQLTLFLWTSQTTRQLFPHGTQLLFQRIQKQSGGLQEMTRGAFTPSLSFSHTPQPHTRSCCPCVLCYPLTVLWPPSAHIIDVKQDEEKTKRSWTPEQHGCALEGTIKHGKRSGFIASSRFIIKWASSINSCSQLSLPPAASWLM